MLKLVCAHVGGAIALLPGRLNFGYELREDATFGPWGPNALTRPPSEYVAQVYLDTMSFHAPAVLCAIGTVGVDHVVFGSDHPPVHVPLARSTALVHSLPLAGEDRAKILGLNAARLLRLG
jgi:aminocarboxymuconate-semialdehyde decarboxylase